MLRSSLAHHFLRAAAVAVALLTARTVAADVHSLDAQAHSLGPLRAVVIARRTLSKGESVGAGDVRVVRRHAGEEPADALDSSDAAIGRVVTVDVAAGAPVLRANVTGGDSGTSGALGADERVMRITDAGGLTPDVGAIVDVYATFASASNTGATAGDTASDASARLVAHGARVLRVDHQSSDVASAGGATNASGILVMVDAKETADLAAAVAGGAVTVAVAPVTDACCNER